MESLPTGMVASALQSRIAYLTKHDGKVRAGVSEGLYCGNCYGVIFFAAYASFL